MPASPRTAVPAQPAAPDGRGCRAVTKALNKIYGGVLKKTVTFPMVLEKIQKLEKSNKEFLKKNKGLPGKRSARI